MPVIADSSALIALAACQGLDILLSLFDDVKIPQAVFDEVTTQDKPLAATLAVFLNGRVEQVNADHWVLAAGYLGRGELEAMALYKQINADLLLIDDRRACLVAEYNRIRCIGALGVLLQAKKRGVITQVRSFVDLLRKSPIHYSDDLLKKVLELAGE